MEKAGIPSVAIVGSSFAGQANFIGLSEGVHNLRTAVYPGAFATDSIKLVRENFKKFTVDQIINGLTRPVSKEERGGEKWNQTKVVHKGNFEEVNTFFHDSMWSDGLTITPPTKERIERFLKYTDRSWNEEIAILPQAALRATPFNIAANAVMAGCRPEHMPILIAAVEAIGDPYFNLRDLASTMMIIPYAIINGPIVKQLGIAYDAGTVSRRCNPALGRAIGLIIKNIAGFKPGYNYMASFGYPTLGFVVAEDEEESPWEPFHVEKGFSADKSTVTMGGTMNWGYQTPFPVPEEIDAMALLLAKHIDRIVEPPLSWMEHDQNMVMVFMTAPSAKMFADAGWSKEDLKQFLWKNSTITVRDIEFLLKYGGRTARKPDQWTLRGIIDAEGYDLPEWLDKRMQDERIPRLISSEEIHILVTGDRGRDKAQALWSWYNKPTTKEIKLPHNWDEFLKGDKN